MKSLGFFRSGDMLMTQRKSAAKKAAAKEVLPKAPMVEVVFELRWKLQTGPKGEVMVLQSDPGLVPLVDRFSKRMKQIGFSYQRDMSHPLQTGPHGVARRFSKSADLPFPLQQIGPGIFASNEDATQDDVIRMEASLRARCDARHLIDVGVGSVVLASSLNELAMGRQARQLSQLEIPLSLLANLRIEVGIFEHLEGVLLDEVRVACALPQDKPRPQLMPHTVPRPANDNRYGRRGKDEDLAPQLADRQFLCHRD